MAADGGCGPRGTTVRSAGSAAQRLAAAVAALGAAAPATPLPPGAVADLPLVEMPARGSGRFSDTFAVFVSGDGGWAGLDEAVARVLARRGIPVVGFDSLRYFWSARTPRSFAADLQRVIEFYAPHWQRGHVILLGYSQGADVLPFAVNRFSGAVRSRIQRLVLIGLGTRAAFEFHLASWMGFDVGHRPILPEVRRLDVAPVLCLYGDDDDESICPEAPSTIVVRRLAGGHHFDGDYDALAKAVLAPVA